ncbi:MAG: Rrf2 family transcriptional regulator [Lachnospiraceae bacterium]|nr:Rrf2 family transcriptional regulator [Lachnospiraceae bacterium]
MKISTKGLYALRMLVDLAERKGCGFIPLKEISDRQNISKKYLEQIIPIFNNTDILRANRGSQGGYMLGKDPSKLTVGEILRITEGSLCPVECAAEHGAGSCDRTMECATFPVWQGLSKVINEYLDSITLQDIVDQQHDSFNYII